MSDESLREFQLNGKQLVFLFMASTIVAVVIFLCGVMVGRGVSAAQVAAVANSTVETGDPTADALPDPTPAAPAAPPADIAPDAPGDEPSVSYPDMLTGDKRTPDISPPKPAATPTVAPSRVAEATPAPAAAAPAPSRRAPEPVTPAVVKASTPSPAPARQLDVEPPGTGFVVQVAATPRRSEADAIAGRLQNKGYSAFITTTGRLFRVRVGKFKERAEANTVAKRLETQERFKPWVTR